MKSLVVLAIPEKEMWYYNADASATRDEAHQLFNRYFDLLKQQIFTDADNLGWSPVFHRNCRIWERCGDISIIALLAHISNDFPIYFNLEHLKNFKMLIALALIENKINF